MVLHSGWWLDVIVVLGAVERSTVGGGDELVSMVVGGD